MAQAYQGLGQTAPCPGFSTVSCGRAQEIRWRGVCFGWRRILGTRLVVKAVCKVQAYMQLLADFLCERFCKQNNHVGEHSHTA